MMPGAMKNARILVADDEASIRLGCERILTAEGHTVEVAEDGEVAWQKFSAHPPDLVLLDLMMPGRDGLSLIPDIKNTDPSTVIIMITGYASFETAVQAIKLGAYDYVPKPFTPSELKIVVQRALEKRNLLLETRKLQEEREKSLRDLALEQSRTRTIINAMGGALLVVNSEREVVLTNPAADALLFQHAPEPDKPLAEITAWQSVSAAVEKAFADFATGIRALSLEVSSPEGDRTFLLSAAGLFDTSMPLPENAAQGIVLVLSDITPMKDLERTKSRFVSMVSHELKAPIAAIEGYLELIISDLPEGREAFQHKLERCRDRAGNMQKLIRELLDLSRIEQGRIDRTLKLIDPRPIIEETLTFLGEEARKRGITLTFEAGTDDIHLEADSGEVSQILTNFVSNAIKYNRDEGTVTVRSSVADTFWILTIEDTGIGIPPEHLPHIGEEFYRVKNSQTVRISGTGLGMAIVKRLLDLNHARLELSSELGIGTRITVYWPLCRTT